MIFGENHSLLTDEKINSEQLSTGLIERADQDNDTHCYKA